MQQNQNVFFPYFSGVGALPGCSLPRQGKVECELQTIPCKKKKSQIISSAAAAHQST